MFVLREMHFNNSKIILWINFYYFFVNVDDMRFAMGKAEDSSNLADLFEGGVVTIRIPRDSCQWSGIKRGIDNRARKIPLTSHRQEGQETFFSPSTPLRILKPSPEKVCIDECISLR